MYETVGAGVEHFPDCVKDIDAMVTFFTDLGFTKVILVGNSTGANKVCFYAGTHPDPRVFGVVLSGSMSDRYSATDEETNRKHQALMEQKIRDGKGDELLTGFDFFPLTPKRWMSLLATGSPEDVFNYRDQAGALTTFEIRHRFWSCLAAATSMRIGLLKKYAKLLMCMRNHQHIRVSW